MDKISIIVPVYNVEEYLPKCLDSILSQSFEDYELILINDGSPDNSGMICDKYINNIKNIISLQIGLDVLLYNDKINKVSDKLVVFFAKLMIG